jgi:glycosyltransferase involved in cell wall biosynthesis
LVARKLVTVVIPCYNQARYLSDALASARAQEYRPIEVIVVDDGSTDDSGAVARREGAQVIHQANAGLGAARNAGLDAARGEFVIFLDADDELLPGAISSGVATLTRDRTLACVVRRCQVMDAERRALPIRYPSVEVSDLYREWLKHNFAWTPGAAVFRRRRISAIGGFPPAIGPAADYAVYLALARQQEVLYQPIEAVRYRQHDSNMSRDPVLMLKATLSVLRRERPHVPKSYQGDYRAGLRIWRRFYGEQIIERLRREWRTGPVGPWGRKAFLTLACECPAVLLTHASRKLWRVLRRTRPAPIEPGRFHPANVPASDQNLSS